MKKSDRTKATKANSKKIPEEIKGKNAFGRVLALISIYGFLGIATMTFFNLSIESYSSSLLLILMGAGFILESQPRKLIKDLSENFQESSFSSLTTLVVGVLAVIAGILVLPQIAIENPTMNALNGILAIIAIFFIIIETWVIKQS